MPTWQSVLGQTLASTKEDSQGESSTREILVGLCASFNRRKKVPLNQKHDRSLPPVGYIENFQVIEDGADAKNWKLVGDVHFHDVGIDEALRGFSYSANLDICGLGQDKLVGVYVPFPHYNDFNLLEDIASIGKGVVSGAWKQKCADPSAVSLLITFALFSAGPAYTNLWNNKISPALKKLGERIGSEGRIELVQVAMGPSGESYGIYFLTRPGVSGFLFPEIVAGINLAESTIANDQLAQCRSVHMVKLKYSEDAAAFQLHSVEYGDGSVVNHQS
jgi:hypothetical protein